MRFKPLLLKIETGQVLTEKQEKDLAIKLGLYKSYLKIALDVVIFSLIFGLVLYGIFAEIEVINKIVLFVAAIILTVLVVYDKLILRYQRMFKYLDAVDIFYKVAFKEFENFDLYYIGQHKNPHVKTLRTKKIYLLTDGYYFVFVEDYFKDTKYKLPKIFTKNETLFLRTIDENSINTEIMIITLDDIDSFYLTEKPLKSDLVNQSKKFEEYYFNFFDQNKYMTDKSLTILSMKNGLTMRLSYSIYDAFLEHMPHKERQ